MTTTETDPTAEAVRRLTAIRDEAQALTRLELPMLRANAGRMVAIASEMLTLVDLDAEHEHPIAWE